MKHIVKCQKPDDSPPAALEIVAQLRFGSKESTTFDLSEGKIDGINRF